MAMVPDEFTKAQVGEYGLCLNVLARYTGIQAVQVLEGFLPMKSTLLGHPNLLLDSLSPCPIG